MPPPGLSVIANDFSLPTTGNDLSPVSTISIPISTESFFGSLSTLYLVLTSSATYTPTNTPESITTTITPSSPNSSPNAIFTLSTVPSQASTAPSTVLSGSNPSPTSLTTPTPSPTSLSTPTPTSSSQGLSSGAIAGIAIGPAAAFLVVALGIFLYFKQERQKLRSIEAKKDESSPTSPGTNPESHTYRSPNPFELGTTANIHEIGQAPENEAGAEDMVKSDPNPAELATNSNLHEIGSSENDNSRLQESSKQAVLEKKASETGATEKDAQAFDPESHIMEPDWAARIVAALETESNFLSPTTSSVPPQSDALVEAPLQGGLSDVSEEEKGNKIPALKQQMKKLKDEHKKLDDSQATKAPTAEIE